GLGLATPERLDPTRRQRLDRHRRGSRGPRPQAPRPLVNPRRTGGPAPGADPPAPRCDVRHRPRRAAVPGPRSPAGFGVDRDLPAGVEAGPSLRAGRPRALTASPATLRPAPRLRLALAQRRCPG